MAKKKTQRKTGRSKKTSSKKKSTKRTGGSKSRVGGGSAAPRRTGKKAASTSTSTSRRPRRGADLSSVSLAQLRAEMERRLADLHQERARLAAELEAVDAEIASLGGGGAGMSGSMAKASRAARDAASGVGRRVRNARNLVDHIGDVLKDKTMSVGEVVEAVQEAGYRTTSPNFRTIVNQTLGSNVERFKRVARGRYTAK